MEETSNTSNTSNIRITGNIGDLNIISNNTIDIIDLLLQALNPDGGVRKQAEGTIELLALNNFGSFLLACSQVLSDESKPKGVRQIASTLIKNTVGSMSKYIQMWEKLDLDSKNQIKQNVLSTLASGDKDIRKAAAFTVAGICKVELRLGQWQDIIGALCQTCRNENTFIKLASITTIGYITQEISHKDLSEEHLIAILSALYELLNTSTDNETQMTTISAFVNFIPYMKRFFEVKEQKNAVLDVLFRYTKNEDIKIRAGAVQCLLEIGRLYYDYIEDNIADFLNVTKLHMTDDDESIAILAYELWCSIGDIEIARQDSKKTSTIYPCKGYCNKSYSELLKVIFHHLLKPVDKFSEESWNLPKAASCLLSILSQCCEYNLIEQVINFITSNIKQTTPLSKEASVLSFGAILDTRHKESIKILVVNSVDNLLTFLVDTSITISQSLKETTSWVIEKIAEIYGEEFENHRDTFDNLFTTLVVILSLPDTRKKVICHICNSLHHFSQAFKPAEGQNSNVISKHLKQTLEVLLKLAFSSKAYDQTDNVAMSCFYAIGSLIENAAPDTRFYIQTFFGDLIEAFKSTLNPKFFVNDKMRFDYQAYIATAIEPCLISGYVNLSFEAAKEMLQLFIETFKERKTVYEEGLMAASSIGLAIGPSFDALIPDYGSYLIFALNSVNETSLCKSAIHSTSDLIRSIGPNFAKYLPQIVPLILGILANSEADKSLKPHSFNVLTDIFIVCREGALSYFSPIMEIILSALEAATYLPEDMEDYESIEYFDKLREHILECVTCIFHTVKDLKKADEFKQFVGGIVVFINRINQKEYTPSTELVKNSLGLLADFCEVYKSDMKQVIFLPVIEEMINKLKCAKSSKINKTVLWSQKVISAAMK